MRKFGNGTREETQYDKADRITVKTQKNERGSILWGEGYVYGSDGKRSATVDNMGRVTLYEYNKQGRLETVYYTSTDGLIKNLKEEAEENGLLEVSEIGTNKYLATDIRAELVLRLNSMQYGLSANLKNLYAFVKESYSYDGNGNRKTKTTPYGTIEYTYDNDNYLLASGSKGKLFVNYTYDKMGNLLTEESPNKTTKYAYNAQNRLIYCEVTDKTKKEYAQTIYAYDAFGRRIIVQDKGEAALRTLYDGLTFDVIKQSQVNENGLFTDSNTTGIRWSKTGKPTGDRYRYISEENANNNINYTNISEERYKTVNSRYRGERTQITANGTLAAQTTSDYGTEYFSTDLIGSIRTTSDSFGMAKSTVSYDAFGSLIEGSLSQNLDHGYLGKQHDPISSLYNYGYRDYRPQSSRFTTVDPIRDGTNWLLYCNGDPVNFIDLWGLEYLDKYGRPHSNTDTSYKDEARVQKLKTVQTKVMADPDLKQGAGGPFKRTDDDITPDTTWCNIATRDVCKETASKLGKSMYNPGDKTGDDTRANHIYDNLAKAAGKNDSSIKEITPMQAQQLANKGYTVIGTNKIEDGIGHVATVAPGYDFDSSAQ